MDNHIVMFFGNAGFSISSIFICLTILFSYYLKRSGNKLEERSRFFILDLCSIIVMSIVEAVYVLYFLHEGMDGPYANMLYHLYSVCILLITLYSWFFVISYRAQVAKEAGRKKSYKNYYFTLITVIEIGLLILLFKSPVHIYREYGLYTFNSIAISTIVLYSLISTSIFVVVLYFRNKTVSTKDLYPSAISLILIILLLIFRVFSGIDINIETFEFTIFALGVFFTVENQDQKLIKYAIQKQSDAQNATASQKEFLSKMSHDIRTPMNTILGLSQLLEKEKSLSREKVLDDIVSIHDSSNQLLKLINNLTDYSKAISDKNEAKDDVYDLQDLLLEINRSEQDSLKENEIMFNVNVHENVPKKVLGDSEKVKKIITNIINNEIPYTRSGQITLEVDGTTKQNRNFQFIFILRINRTTMKKNQIDLNSETLIQDYESSIDSDSMGLLVAKNLADIIEGKIEYSEEMGNEGIYKLIVEQIALSDDTPVTHKEETEEEVKEEPQVTEETKEEVHEEVKEESSVEEQPQEEPQQAEEPKEETKEEVHEEDKEETSVEEKPQEEPQQVEEPKEETKVEVQMEEKEPEEKEESPVEEKSQEEPQQAEETQEEKFEVKMEESGQEQKEETKETEEPKEKQEESKFEVKMKESEQESKEEKVEETPSTNKVDLTRKRLLIIDNNNESSVAMKRMLIQYNAIVEICNSIPNAIEKVTKNKYDLAFLNYSMLKNVDGDTTNKIKENVPSLIGLINTSLDEEIDPEKGFKDCLLLPIKEDEVDDLLNKLFNQNEATQEVETSSTEGGVSNE